VQPCLQGAACKRKVTRASQQRAPLPAHSVCPPSPPPRRTPPPHAAATRPQTNGCPRLLRTPPFQACFFAHTIQELRRPGQPYGPQAAAAGPAAAAPRNDGGSPLAALALPPAPLPPAPLHVLSAAAATGAAAGPAAGAPGFAAAPLASSGSGSWPSLAALQPASTQPGAAGAAAFAQPGAGAGARGAPAAAHAAAYHTLVAAGQPPPSPQLHYLLAPQPQAPAQPLQWPGAQGALGAAPAAGALHAAALDAAGLQLAHAQLAQLQPGQAIYIVTSSAPAVLAPPYQQPFSAAPAAAAPPLLLPPQPQPQPQPQPPLQQQTLVAGGDLGRAAALAQAGAAGGAQSWEVAAAPPQHVALWLTPQPPALQPPPPQSGGAQWAPPVGPGAWPQPPACPP
jgi:hypothetical protein